jgi:hypothetical protein
MISIVSSKTFYISNGFKLPWNSAMMFCQENGMSLATFDSYDEAEDFNENAGKEVWVGINDIQKEGRFVKISDGKPVGAEDLPWSSEQPVVIEGDKNCVKSKSINVHQTDLGFSHERCSRPLRFACEM